MSPDYFAPDLRVLVDGAPLAADAAKYVTNVSLITEPDTLNELSMTLANPLPDMRWTHGSDAAVFREGRAVTVELGYVGRTRRMFDGDVTRIAPSFPEAGAPTVTVTGHTRMHALRGATKTRTFTSVTDGEIAGQVAHDAGLTPDADPGGGPYDYVIQYNETDLAFLMSRARRIRFELTVEGRTLRFKRARDADEPTYTLVWRHPQRAFAPGARALPLRTFSPATNTLGQVTEVVVRGQHPTSRATIEGRAGSGAEESRMGAVTGADVAAAALGGGRTEVVVDQPVASEQEATALATAIYNQRLLDFVVGSGSTIGLPELQAGQVVDLDGLGDRFNGHYYVRQATHSLSSSGYSTSFTVASNAIA